MEKIENKHYLTSKSGKAQSGRTRLPPSDLAHTPSLECVSPKAALSPFEVAYTLSISQKIYFLPITLLLAEFPLH